MKKYTITFCLVLPLYLNAMETKKSEPVYVVISENNIAPQSTNALFHFKHALAAGKESEAVFSNNILITPDKKELIISRSEGEVFKIPFDSLDSSERLKVWIEHKRVKHTPMICITTEVDDQWSVASAGNYTTTTNERWAELIIRKNGNNMHWSREDLNEAIQALTIDPSGKKVAVAHKNSIRFIYPEANTEQKINWPLGQRDQQIITDLDFDNTGDRLVVCHDGGKISLISCIGKPEIIKTISTDTSIDKIHYAHIKDILYAVNDGKVMILDLYPFLSQDSDVIMKACPFDDSNCAFECVSFDQSRQVGFIKWTKKENLSEKERGTIQVQKRISPTIMHDAKLKAPFIESTYSHESYEGTLKKSAAYFIQCALFGNRAVAIGTDGAIRVWEITAFNELALSLFNNKITSITPERIIEKAPKTNSPVKQRKSLIRNKTQTSPGATSSDDEKKQKRSSLVLPKSSENSPDSKHRVITSIKQNNSPDLTKALLYDKNLSFATVIDTKKS